MKILPLIILTMCLAACSGGVDKLEAQYRRECFGDQTLKCRAMMVDLAIAKVEAGMESMKERKDVIIGCIGEEKYNEGILLAKERIAYLDKSRPSFIAKLLWSDEQVSFDPPPFEHERELRAFLLSTNTCKKDMVGDEPKNGETTAAPSQAPVANSPSSPVATSVPVAASPSPLPAVEAAYPEMSALAEKEEIARGHCKVMDLNEADTKTACDQRDTFANELKSKGWCFDNAEQKWAMCH